MSRIGQHSVLAAGRPLRTPERSAAALRGAGNIAARTRAVPGQSAACL